MKWGPARDKDGNILERVRQSDAGYRVARFTVAGADLYRASKGGRFLGLPTPDPAEAAAICERHYQIVGDDQPEGEG